MVAESGGYIGMLLGYSVLDLSLIAEGMLQKVHKWMENKMWLD